MKLRTKIVWASAGTLALLPLGAAAGSPAPIETPGSSSSGSSVTTLQFRSPPFVQTRVPVPDDPGAPLATGDRLFWTARLLKNGSLVAVMPHACTVSGDRYLLCQATALLPKGQVQLQGMLDVTATDVPPISIVGGSGCYRNASGQLEATINNDGSTELTFRIKDACRS